MMIPMSRPGWFDDLPDYLSEAEYRDLPEDIARTIEIVHGHVIRCESPVPRHNRIARRLSFALESARSHLSDWLDRVREGEEVVVTDRGVPVARLLGISATATLQRLAADGVIGRDVEVSSPSTAREDLLDKRAQYAAAGIPLYLVVVLDDKYDIWEIREFHLDAAADAYRLHAVHRSVLDLEQPVRLTLPISELVTA